MATVASTKTFAVTNPATGEVLQHVPRHGVEETRAAIEAAERAYPAWRARTAKERAAVLRRLSDLMLERQEELARLLTSEQGKPLAEARGEIAYAASFFEWFGEEAKRVYGDTIPAHQPDKRIVVLKEPIGVTAGITPWNFPAAMITRKAAPALAAGCTIVVKPAEQTPLTALALADLAAEAGVPDGVLQVVTGDAEDAPVIGGELTSNPTVRKLSFTGSTEIGKLLMAQCAGTVKKVSLELGGNAPFLVFDDADLDAAVEGAIMCKFRNSGQTCVSANRILVQDSVHDEFVSRFEAAVGRLVVGNGLDDGTQVGPLIDESAVEKVERHVADATGCGRRARARRPPPRRDVLRADRAHGRRRLDGDDARGDVRPRRRDPALRRRGRGDPARERHPVWPRRLLLQPRTSAVSGASPRRSSTGSSASTPGSSRPRWRRSAG